MYLIIFFINLTSLILSAPTFNHISLDLKVQTNVMHGLQWAVTVVH